MNKPVSRRPGELVFAGLLLAVSCFALHEAFLISGFASLTSGGVVPMLAAGVMVLSGLSILRDSWRRQPQAPHDLKATVQYLFHIRLLWFAALLAAYGLAIPWIGFLAASGLFLFVSVFALWQRGPVLALGVTGLSILCIHGIFRIVFQVVLPQGTLWQ